MSENIKAEALDIEEKSIAEKEAEVQKLSTNEDGDYTVDLGKINQSKALQRRVRRIRCDVRRVWKSDARKRLVVVWEQICLTMYQLAVTLMLANNLKRMKTIVSVRNARASERNARKEKNLCVHLSGAHS